MTNWKRMLVFCVMACLFMTWMPVSVSAVDPVSAATMANAFAQAVTAYGASQGVSMTFDVANTDGIGEGVHELWDQYQADMANSSVTVSDYQNIAASAFPTLWIKIGEKIGVNLDAASVGEIDGFWNWLLSGPAEMQKVDNQYYEWSVDSQTGSVLPIDVYSYSFLEFNGYTVPTFSTYYFIRDGFKFEYTFSSPVGIYATFNSHYYYFVAIFSTANGVPVSNLVVYNASNNSVVRRESDVLSSNSSYGGSYKYKQLANAYDQELTYYVNTSIYTASYFDPVTVFGAYSNDTVSSGESGISVRPYVGDAVPQDVYIPDNTDVNYEPIPAAIPTDITWDDALFGDGTGTLTDAQSEAVTQAVDQAIADNPAKTIELADTANPPAPAPGEVYIPFLPVTLPSFNFNFSGIWHYVVSWIGSLGAWFSMVLTVWANLPYAMTVPVYACLVILIVLGVYRRFLS